MSNVSVPSYLNEALIRKALDPVYGNDYEIESLDFELKSSNGYNYTSNIYRAAISLRVAGTLKEIRLIVKDLHKGPVDYGMKEFAMYDKVLLQMHEIINAGRAEAEKVKFAPDCLFASKEKGEELYVFEDVCALGYELASRWDGLNEEQVQLALKKLAQFHATSMIFAEKYPDVTLAIGKSHLHYEVPDFLKDECYGSIEAAADHIEKLDGFEEMAAKVRKNLAAFDRKIIAAVSDESCAFKVINHGDSWLSNLLFKPKSVDKSSYDDVVMVDYQLSCYGNPGIDLNFFLHTSVQPSTLKLKRYQLLRDYYKHFKTTLIELKMEPNQVPSFEMLLNEIKRAEYYSFFTAVCELPLVCLNSELAQNISTAIFTDTEAIERVRKTMFHNERVHQTMLHTLDRLNELGVLD